MKCTIKFLQSSFSFLLLVMLSAAVMLSSIETQAQAPQKFNYQGIARDTKGNPMAHQRMTLKLSVLPTADATISEYEEIQTITTNEFGLYTLQIGAGTAIAGEMKTVKWETGNKYIKVAIDPKGGNDFVDAGTSQLLSVPYAIYADKAGATATDKTRTGTVSSNAAHVAGDANYLTKFTALNTIGKSLLFDNGNTVGLGTSTPTANAKFHIFQPNLAGNTEYLRMQNLDSFAFGKFLIHNDIPTNYATFTKYGSKFPGGYPGVTTMFPYANMLAFGNNLGPFMLANNGNVGIGIVTAGTTTLKFNAQQNTGNVGIGGSAIPSAPVHFNNNATSETLLITNNTSGHSNTDGLEIKNTGNAASITNKENSTLSLGTNNTSIVTMNAAGNMGIGTNSPTAKLDVNGQVKIQGGNPGVGKVLTSDANGLATWQAPVLSYDEATANVPANNTDVLVITSTTNNWKGGKSIMVVGHSYVNAAPGALPPNVLYSDIFVNIEVWIEYNHPTFGNIKFKSVYENTLTSEGVITLPINCILPSVSGLAYTVGARNKNSTYTFYDIITSTWLTLPLSIEVRPEVQGIEL